MGIGTIGATSAPSAFQPAGSADLVASHKIRGYEKISLNAGDYVVHADEDMCFFDGRDYLGYIKSGESGTISIAANSTEVFAEAMSFKWKPVDTSLRPASNISAQRPYSVSDDGQIVCELHGDSTLYISTDGGQTYGSGINGNTIWTSNNSNGFHRSSPAVAPNGTIYVAPYSNQSGGNRVSYSTNNGASWSTIGRADSGFDFGSMVARVGDKIVTVHHRLTTATDSLIQIYDPAISTSASQHYFYVNGLNSYPYHSATYYTGIASIPGTNRARIFWYDSSNGTSYAMRYYDLDLLNMPINGGTAGYNSTIYMNDSQPQQALYYFGELGKERIAYPYSQQSSTATWYVGVPYADGNGVAFYASNARSDASGSGTSGTPYADIGTMVATANVVSPLFRHRVRAGDGSNKDVFGAATAIFAPYNNTSVRTINVDQYKDAGKISPSNASGSSSYRPKKLLNGTFFMPSIDMEALPANLYIYSKVA